MTKWWENNISKESPRKGGSGTESVGYQQTERFGAKPGEDGYNLKSSALRNDPLFQTPDEREFIDDWISHDLKASQEWKVTVSRLHAIKSLFPQEPTISTRDGSGDRVAARFLNETSGNTNGNGSSMSPNGRETVHDGWNHQTGNHDFIITELIPDTVDPVSGTVTHYTKTTRKLDPTKREDAIKIARHNADQIGGDH